MTYDNTTHNFSVCANHAAERNSRHCYSVGYYVHAPSCASQPDSTASWPRSQSPRMRVGYSSIGAGWQVLGHLGYHERAGTGRDGRVGTKEKRKEEGRERFGRTRIMHAR